MRHWKCRVRVKLHRGFESLPLRCAFEELDLHHQVYEVPHFREKNRSRAALAPTEGLTYPNHRGEIDRALTQ